MIELVSEFRQDIFVSDACKGVGIPRSTYYYHLGKLRKLSDDKRAKHKPEWALSAEERKRVLDVLHSEEFIDKAPAQVYATLLDRGIYLCSVRTMYRILKENKEVRERRNVRRHPNYKKPELLATDPDQVWSWDITKLKTFQKFSMYYLYVIIDIFSRYVVGWMVAYNESAKLAKHLIEETCKKQMIAENQLTIHADRGSSMKSKAVQQLLSDLQVEKTHSRPRVSDDNPFSEAQFKTLKYCPQFPERFGSIEEARSFCRLFFQYYNREHYHSGINYLTPEMVHYRFSEEVVIQRNQVLSEAFAKHPERFRNKPPKAKNKPNAVWINKPDLTNAEDKVGEKRWQWKKWNAFERKNAGYYSMKNH